MDDRLKPLLQGNFRPDRVAAFVAWLVHEDTRVQNGMFEVGGGMASRLALAQYLPYVHTDADAPEAWAELGDEVRNSGTPTEESNSAEFLTNQILNFDPDFPVDGGLRILEDQKI